MALESLKRYLTPSQTKRSSYFPHVTRNQVAGLAFTVLAACNSGGPKEAAEDTDMAPVETDIVPVEPTDTFCECEIQFTLNGEAIWAEFVIQSSNPEQVQSGYIRNWGECTTPFPIYTNGDFDVLNDSATTVQVECPVGTGWGDLSAYTCYAVYCPQSDAGTL